VFVHKIWLFSKQTKDSLYIEISVIAKSKATKQSINTMNNRLPRSFQSLAMTMKPLEHLRSGLARLSILLREPSHAYRPDN
jgi:hypothetical protein